MSFAQQLNNIVENFISQVSVRYSINVTDLKSMWNGADSKTTFAPPSFVPSTAPPTFPTAFPTPASSRTTSVESSGGGCIYVMVKGLNAGQPCAKKCAAGVANYCSAHKKYENQPPKAARTTSGKNVPAPVLTTKSIIGKPIPGLSGYLHNTETNIVFVNNVAVGRFQNDQVTCMSEDDKNTCRARSWTFDPDFLTTGKLSPPTLPTLATVVKPPHINLPPPPVGLPSTLPPPPVGLPSTLPPHPVGLPSTLPPPPVGLPSTLPPPPVGLSIIPPPVGLPSTLPPPPVGLSNTARTIPKPPNFTTNPPTSLQNLQQVALQVLGVNTENTDELQEEEVLEEELPEGLEEVLEEENLEPETQ